MAESVRLSLFMRWVAMLGCSRRAMLKSRRQERTEIWRIEDMKMGTTRIQGFRDLHSYIYLKKEGLTLKSVYPGTLIIL